MKEIEDLDKYGYTILNHKIDDHTINSVINDLSSSYRYDSENYNLNNRIENAFLQSDAVKCVACNKYILEFLENYFDESVFPFQTLNFERGSGQKLHSDFYHFASSEFSKMVGVWIALENINNDSGPLLVCPFSHKLPYIFPEDIKLKAGSKKEPYQFYSEYEYHIENLVKERNLETKKVTLSKGEILVWHSNLIHGGSSVLNKNATRLSQVTHYFTKGHFYFSPISSKRNFLFRSYRMPHNIMTGKRTIPFFK